MQKQSKFNLFIYQSGVEFSGKSNEIVFNAVSLISFMQIRLKNTFLQLNIFAPVGNLSGQNTLFFNQSLNRKIFAVLEFAKTIEI